MAPHPAPTPAPQVPATTAPLTRHSYTTVLPLPFIWTPPPSCASATPVIKAGTCSNSACRGWLNAAESEDYGIIYANFPHFTTDYSMVGTECVAPSSQAVIDFSYYPAQGCPQGYSTVSARRVFNDVSAICCPSSYALEVETDTANTYFWCHRPVRTGEVINQIAWGKVDYFDPSGSATDWYVATSDMGMTTITSLPSTGQKIYFEAIQMIVPSSLVTGSTSMAARTTHVSATPSSSATATPPSKPPFHIGGLGYAASIGVLVVIIVVGLWFCSGFCTACCDDSDTTRTSRPVPVSNCEHASVFRCSKSRKGKCCACRISGSTPADYTLLDDGPKGFCSPCRSNWQTPIWSKLFPHGCEHKDFFNCSNGPSRVCCACGDHGRANISLGDRVARYCFGCRSRWLRENRTEFPPAWLPFPGCEHSVAAVCRTKGIHGKCCCCRDTVQEKVTLRTRVRNYCVSCNAHWTNLSPHQHYPAHWLPFPCAHAEECAGRGFAPGSCCQCADTRTSKMTISTRTKNYCIACATRVRTLASTGRLNELPVAWQPIPRSCPHEESRPCTESGSCCTCRDGSNRQAWKSLSWKLAKFCKTCAAEKTWMITLRKEPEGDWKKRLHAEKPLPVGMEDKGPRYERLMPTKPVEVYEGAVLDLPTAARPDSPGKSRVRVNRIQVVQASAVSFSAPKGNMLDEGPTYGPPKLSVPVTAPSVSSTALSGSTAASTHSAPSSSGSVTSDGKVKKTEAALGHAARPSRRLPAVARLSSLADFHKLEAQLH